MSVVRNLERRLESLVEGLAGKVFRGQMHPVEMAARLVREADLALRSGADGHVAPNTYVVRVNPSDLNEGLPPEVLSKELEQYLTATVTERGWEVEGPVEVLIEMDRANPGGTVACSVKFTPGVLPVWAVLRGSAGDFELRLYRNRVGRSPDNDLVLDDPEVSRQHAVIWLESGEAWISDLGSSNGTIVDGVHIDSPTALQQGSVISFGPAGFAFRRV